MASFFLDKSRCSWTCQYKDPSTGKFKAKRQDDDGKPFLRRKDAIAWYKNSGYDIETGKLKDPGKHTVESWVRAWAESCKASIQPGTHRINMNAIEKHIIPAIGNVKLPELKPEHARLLVGRMTQVLKPSSVRLIYGRFASAMRMAEEDGMIQHSPCTRRIALPPLPVKRPHYCTAYEGKSIIQEASDSVYALPIYICATLGTRRGEALGIKWEDIDGNRVHIHMQVTIEDNKVVYKQLKTKRSDRWLDIPKSLQAMLALRKKEQAEQKLKLGPLYSDEGFVCAGPGGGCLHPASMSVTARRIIARSSADPRTHLHDLRHTYATLLYQAGYPIDVVADLLGDTVETAQKYYVGENKERQREAAQTIDVLIGK